MGRIELTIEKAFDIAIELWEWLAETGKDKNEWSGWKIYGRMLFDCPLCEYTAFEDAGGNVDCKSCPITSKYQTTRKYHYHAGMNCYKTYFAKWEQVTSKKSRQKYAALFLQQLKDLKNVQGNNL